ncbi:MAG TPA: hypothetical protein VLG73_17195, partial [Shinella sp.]|nr:hypothetical protein [Shinella sp.]
MWVQEMWGNLSPSIGQRRIMLLAAASVLALDAAVAQEQGAGQATGQGGTVLEAIVVEGGAGERGDGP